MIYPEFDNLQLMNTGHESYKQSVRELRLGSVIEDGGGFEFHF